MATGGVMLMLNVLVVPRPMASVTVTGKLKVPVTVGVPLMAPVTEFKLRDVGREPTVTDQASGVMPPVAARA